jgi:uncharacterized protein (DUF608 family)
VPQLPALEKKTVQWVTAFVNSDLPPEVKEAALFNLSTLRTQTCFRTADGRFFAFEGVATASAVAAAHAPTCGITNRQLRFFLLNSPNPCAEPSLPTPRQPGIDEFSGATAAE